jgi:ankyrin repeat protein
MKALLILFLPVLIASTSHADDRLTESACNGDLARVRRYLRDGDMPSDKALFCASTTSFNVEMTDLLLAAGANPDATYAYQNPLTNAPFQMTMLQYSVQTGRQDIGTVLLNRKAKIDFRFQAIAQAAVPYATTALGLAAATGKAETVRFLLSKGAKPNVDQAAALFAVASRPELERGTEILHDLIAAGGDPTIRNADGRSVCEVSSGAYRTMLQATGGCP